MKNLISSLQTLEISFFCEISHKRGSVLSNHLSRLTVASKLKRHTQRRDGQPLKCLSIRSCSRWCEISHKRGSVLSNHLSRLTVASKLKRHTQRRDGQPLKCLSIRSCSRWGLHSRDVSTTLVSSYLAFPPLPILSTLTYKNRRYISVALSFKSP